MKHGAQDFKEKLDMFVCGDIKYEASQEEKKIYDILGLCIYANYHIPVQKEKL